MAPEIKRSQEEIDQVLNEAQKITEAGPSKFSGLKYEDGLVAMYEWLTEDEPEFGPMEA